MKLKSQSGFSLVEIGIALILASIFMVSSITLISASNENYRRIEQRSIALSYATKAIEATLLDDASIELSEIIKNAKDESNMEIDIKAEDVSSSDRTKTIQIITASVTYQIKRNVNGDSETLKLQTLKVNK